MVSIWESVEDHDRAIEEETNHPAYGFFEACGLDPTHAIYQVIGRLKSPYPALWSGITAVTCGLISRSFIVWW